MNSNSPIEEAAQIINAGGLVSFPTETVYGLGADAFNPEAVARIFEVKQRPSFDPLIVHIAAERELEGLAECLPDNIAEIAARFWPGPLTIVVPKRSIVPDIVTSGLESVAVRWPAHPIAQELIRAAHTPIAAPSANLFGKVSPTCAEHVEEQLGGKIDMILDGGSCTVGVESSIVSFVGRKPKLLRHGGYSHEELESVMGPIAIAQSNPLPQAPGMLAKHYAPRTPVVFMDRYSGTGEKLGMLCFKGPAEAHNCAEIEILSCSGDLREAASNLFRALRKLDRSGVDVIIAERFPDQDLGRAINDRLSKACNSF